MSILGILRPTTPRWLNVFLAAGAGIAGAILGATFVANERNRKERFMKAELDQFADQCRKLEDELRVTKEKAHHLEIDLKMATAPSRANAMDALVRLMEQNEQIQADQRRRFVARDLVEASLKEKQPSNGQTQQPVDL